MLNPPRNDDGMVGYLRTFLHFDSPAIRRAVLLNFAAALTEGASLLLLLPLLSLAGVLGKEGGQPAWLPPLDRALSSLGISWSLEMALLVFVALIFIQSQLTLRRDRLSYSLQMRFGDHLRERLYAAITRANWSFLSGNHSGELLNALTAEVQRIVLGTYFLLRLFTLAVLSVAYLAVAFRLSFGLTLLALATGGVLWLLLRRADGAAQQSGVMLGNANRQMFSQIQEFLSAMKLIKIHGEEAGNRYRFNGWIEQVSHRNIEFQQVRTRVQAVYRVGGAAALALISYVALIWFNLPAAHLLVLIAIFARMLPQLSELQGGRQQMLHMLPAFAAWRSLLDTCEAARDAQQSGGKATPLVRGLEFEDVEYRHAASHHVLHVQKLLVPAMRTTAILGASGAGKTTLLDLLSGLLAPDRGSVSVDGTPLARLPGWRQGIAYIPQETLIQFGSVRDNLAWGNDAPDEAAMWQALEQAALAGLVRRLPQGLDTEVGERGVRLSGGEKQRLALARALLRRPQLLILDEATSALDAENHRLVMDAVRALHGNMTVLIVTHRHEELEGLIDGVVRVEQGVVGEWQAVGGVN